MNFNIRLPTSEVELPTSNFRKLKFNLRKLEVESTAQLPENWSWKSGLRLLVWTSTPYPSSEGGLSRTRRRYPLSKWPTSSPSPPAGTHRVPHASPDRVWRRWSWRRSALPTHSVLVRSTQTRPWCMAARGALNPGRSARPLRPRRDVALPEARPGASP